MSIASAGRAQQAAENYRDKWDRRFLQVAENVGTWSKDPGTRVGAVLVFDGCIVATGYNGLPRAMQDVNLEDRPSKLSRTVHAEMNAILNAIRAGASARGCTLYTTFFPCDRCAVHIIQAGVTRVVSKLFPQSSDEKLAEWQRAAQLSNQYFAEAGVEVQLVDFYSRRTP